MEEKWDFLPCAIAALEGLGTGESGQLEGSLPLLPLPRQQPAVAWGSAESVWLGWVLALRHLPRLVP